MRSNDGVKVGDELWLVSNIRSATGELVKVERVGPKWFGIGGRRRVKRDGLGAYEGDYCYGQAYCSRAEWERMQVTAELWDRLRKAVEAYRPPAHVTAEQLAAALEILSPAPWGA